MDVIRFFDYIYPCLSPHHLKAVYSLLSRDPHNLHQSSLHGEPLLSYCGDFDQPLPPSSTTWATNCPRSRNAEAEGEGEITIWKKAATRSKRLAADGRPATNTRHPLMSSAAPPSTWHTLPRHLPIRRAQTTTHPTSTAVFSPTRKPSAATPEHCALCKR